MRLQALFASQLDDDNAVVDTGAWQKAQVRVKRNAAGRRYADEVRRLRNQLLTCLGAPSVDPDEDLHYGDEGTVHDAGGTLRMSADRSGVVDGDLRFETYDNLYAADLSVFPMIPAANPALTLAALVLRLADHLRARI